MDNQSRLSFVVGISTKEDYILTMKSESIGSDFNLTSSSHETIQYLALYFPLNTDQVFAMYLPTLLEQDGNTVEFFDLGTSSGGYVPITLNFEFPYFSSNLSYSIFLQISTNSQIANLISFKKQTPPPVVIDPVTSRFVSKINIVNVTVSITFVTLINLLLYRKIRIV